MIRRNGTRAWRALGAALAGAAAFALAAPAAAQDLRTVPLDHWAYEIAEELVLRRPALAGEVYLSARPWREGDFRRLVERAEADPSDTAAGLVTLLADAFPADSGRLTGTDVRIHNEVSLVYEGDVRKDGMTLDPPFLPPRADLDDDARGNEEEVNAPEHRGFAQHDFALQYSDRFALGWRYAIDANVRNDPTRFRQREVREGSDAGFALLDAYGVFHWRILTASLGRNELVLGPGRGTSVLISDSIPAMDQLRVEIGLDRIRFTGLIGLLSDDLQNRSLDEDGRAIPGSEPPELVRDRVSVDRFLYLHRVDWKVMPWLQVAVGETALVTGIDKGLEPRYANLLVPFFVSQQDEDEGEGLNVDIQVHADGVVTAPGGAQAWVQVMAQEFFVDADKRDEIGNQLAWKVGGAVAGDALGLPGASAGAEYTRVDVFTYLHRGLNTNFSQYGVPIGSSLGPDADMALGWITYRPRPTMRFTVEGMVRRGGENSIETLESASDAGNPEFPSGVDQREVRLGAEAWALLPRWGLEGLVRASTTDVTSLGNEEGVDDTFWRAFVGLRFRWQFLR